MGAATSFLTAAVVPFVNAGSLVLMAAQPILHLFRKLPQHALSFEQAIHAPGTPENTHSKKYWEEQRRSAHEKLGIDTVSGFQ